MSSQYVVGVFPTHVGVFLLEALPPVQMQRLPHARGGVSIMNFRTVLNVRSSPRTWGCFYHGPHAVPSEYSLPHARGGVSQLVGIYRHVALSSPRTWGCFSMKLIGLDTEGVFPTHVGVFPAQQATDTPDRRLPHARGGVSTIYGASSTVMPSSPRTWGCFFSSGAVSMTRFVFPTHVGVFLKKPVGKRIRRRLPHARGGVSWLSLLFPP